MMFLKILVCSSLMGCLFHLLKATESSTGPLNSDALVKTNGQLGKHNINDSGGKDSVFFNVFLGGGPLPNFVLSSIK